MKQTLLDEFRDITVHDPLFAAEGLNLDNAFWAIDDLEDITEKLEALDQSVRGQFFFLLHPLKEILHPFRFLRKFLESERARQHFLALPDLDRAKKLIASYYATLHALQKDLYAYRSACLAMQKKTLSRFPRAKAYNFYHHKVPFADFNAAIDMMLDNTRALQKEIDHRKNLLFTPPRRSKRTFSSAGIEQIPQRNLAKKLPGKARQMLHWIEEGWDVTYLLKKRFGTITTELTGPIFYELAQFDEKPATHQFFIYVARDKSATVRFASALLADEFHFLELTENKYNYPADIFTYGPLLKKGINYWFQPATMFYFTPDLTYYPDLMTIFDLKQRPFLNRQLVSSQKSSMLDLLLWNGYFHNLSYLMNVRARKEAGRPAGSLHYVLIARSYASLYYLPFNRSVWRLDKKPNFLGFPTEKPAMYITLDQLPASVKKNGLRKIFQGGRIRAEDFETYLTNLKN